MSHTEASPGIETWETLTTKLADILRQHPGGVKFLDRIIDETAPDPGLLYWCPICFQWTPGDEGRFYGEHNAFVCNYCHDDGRDSDFIPKEGI